MGRTAAVALPLVVMSWWLLLAGTLALTLPGAASSATSVPFLAVAGQTAHVRLTGLTHLPVPVDRAAFDEYQRGMAQADEAAIEEAFAASEWVSVSDRQAVRIAQVDGHVVQVELLEGAYAGRSAWLTAGHLGP
ncbi:MAG: hypothetical protein U0893_16160 [Chloroflexota bacterium]